jgi:hypothetical protein
MKGFRMDQYGQFHPYEVIDYSATHAAGAPAKKTAAKKPGKHSNKFNRATGKATVTGSGDKKLKAGFKPHKVATSKHTVPAKHVSGPASHHWPPDSRLHHAATKLKHTTGHHVGHVPQKRAKGPSLGGGPAGAPYVDASGNPLDSAPWQPGVPYENAVYVDQSGEQWLGQISINDGSFTALEVLANPSSPPPSVAPPNGGFGNPVANLTNGHAYLFPPLQPGVAIPAGGWYSDLIQIQTDLGLFANGLPAGANVPTSTQPGAPSAPYQAPYPGDGGQPTGDGGYPGDGGGMPGDGGGGMPGDGGGMSGDGGMGDGGAMSAFGAALGAPGGGYSGDGGLPMAPTAPTPSGMAAPSPIFTPSGVAPSTLQSLLQQAAATGAAQAAAQLATDGGQGGQGDGGQGDGGQGDGGGDGGDGGDGG